RPRRISEGRPAGAEERRRLLQLRQGGPRRRRPVPGGAPGAAPRPAARLPPGGVAGPPVPADADGGPAGVERRECARAGRGGHGTDPGHRLPGVPRRAAALGRFAGAAGRAGQAAQVRGARAALRADRADEETRRGAARVLRGVMEWRATVAISCSRRCWAPPTAAAARGTLASTGGPPCSAPASPPLSASCPTSATAAACPG